MARARAGGGAGRRGAGTAGGRGGDGAGAAEVNRGGGKGEGGELTRTGSPPHPPPRFRPSCGLPGSPLSDPPVSLGASPGLLLPHPLSALTAAPPAARNDPPAALGAPSAPRDPRLPQASPLLENPGYLRRPPSLP